MNKKRGSVRLIELRSPTERRPKASERREEVLHIKPNLPTVLVLLIVIGAGAFFAGMQYAKMQQRKGTQFTRRAGQNLRPVAGDIINLDEKSITVKLQDGSSKIVILSDTTTINKQATGSKSDLKTGEKVAVFGTDNSDGSVTAQSVQLNPQFRK